DNGKTVVMSLAAPAARQDGADGRQASVSVRYAVAADGTVGLEVGGYDKARPLTIETLNLAGPPSNRPGNTFPVTLAIDDVIAGTLRWAINKANASAGPDTIVFNLPGGGVQTIYPLAPLPAINEAVTIDGASQPGFSGSPVVAVSGAQAGSNSSGFV